MCQPWGGGEAPGREALSFRPLSFLGWVPGSSAVCEQSWNRGQGFRSLHRALLGKGKDAQDGSLGPGVKPRSGFCRLQGAHQVAPSNHESASSGLRGAWGLPQSVPALPPGPGEPREDRGSWALQGAPGVGSVVPCPAPTGSGWLGHPLCWVRLAGCAAQVGAWGPVGADAADPPGRAQPHLRADPAAESWETPCGGSWGVEGAPSSLPRFGGSQHLSPGRTHCLTPPPGAA